MTFTSSDGLRSRYLSCSPVFDESTNTRFPVTAHALLARFIVNACTRCRCARQEGDIARATSRNASKSAPRCKGLMSLRTYVLVARRISEAPPESSKVEPRASTSRPIVCQNSHDRTTWPHEHV